MEHENSLKTIGIFVLVVTIIMAIIHFLASPFVFPSSRTVKIPPIKKIATTMNANITINSEDINF